MVNFFRRLPPFKGKQRLARVFLASAIKNEKDIEVKGKNDCSYLLPNIFENVGFDIFINGEYEPEIQKLILNLLPANGTFFDLGANIGSIVIPTAKLRPDVKALAVEAAPWVFSYLENNILRNNLSNVHLYNNALFNVDDEELNFFSPLDKFGKGSLSPVFTHSGVKVKTKTIDTIVNELSIRKVDIIKIDVEGFEYFVFRGAEKLLSSVDAPIIIFEFIDWSERSALDLESGSAQKLLMNMGYILYEIRGERLIRIKDVLTSGSLNLIASKNELNV